VYIERRQHFLGRCSWRFATGWCNRWQFASLALHLLYSAELFIRLFIMPYDLSLISPIYLGLKPLAGYNSGHKVTID
jgi:hypothetical protein